MSEARERERERVIQAAKERGEFGLAEDGFTYWWPSPNGGFLASHHLRILADELDRLNEPWRKEIETFFAQKGEDSSEGLYCQDPDGA